MKNMKLTIVLLALVLVVLVIAFTFVYTKSYTVKKPKVVQQEESQTPQQDDEEEPNKASEYISDPKDIVIEDDKSADTKLALDTIQSDDWQRINKYLGNKFTANDVTYIGYDQSTDGLYFYQINNSDVSIATIITDEYIGVERFTNTIDTTYGTIYFDKGIPSNSVDVYTKIPNDQLYETDYVSGNTVKYWPITNKDDVKEVSL